MLARLRTAGSSSTSPNTPQNQHPRLPIPSLASLAARHHQASQSLPPPLLSLSGRYLPFLYHLVSTLLAAPHAYAVVVVDQDHRFDVTRLVSASPPSPATGTTYSAAAPSAAAATGISPGCTVADLRHLYVYRPARGPHLAPVQACIAAAREHMLYGRHGSRHRTWWGTVVTGGGNDNSSAATAATTPGGERVVADVMASWKGWLHVQRQETTAMPTGFRRDPISLEEALAERTRRAAEGEKTKAVVWEARAREGTYVWTETRE